MRLINVHTLDTQDFSSDWPEYAVLSHRWLEGEMSFEQYQNPLKRSGTGYCKIQRFCGLLRNADWAHGQATHERIEWAWVDTCCIDKTSSAELSEAINSMWAWYQDAAICVAYISDCESHESRPRTLRSLRASPWFRRGWTLQELLAPKDVIFYSHDWQCLGRRNETNDLRQAIRLATSIQESYLEGRKHVTKASVAERMSWASTRKTTRGEDLAYCLMGIFNVNMPLLYGEGQEKAFYRLQEQIVRQSNDESLFAFGLNMYGSQPALASHPRQFVDCEYVRAARRLYRPPYTITNAGLEFESPAIKWQVGRDIFYILNLNCGRLAHPEGDNAHSLRLRGCIMILRKIGDQFVRDFSWEHKIEKTSASAARDLIEHGIWQKLDSMKFHIALTASDVYAAEIDERQSLFNPRNVQKLWYEDGAGSLFAGYAAIDSAERETDMPAFDDGDFEISDDEEETESRVAPAEVSPMTAHQEVAAISLGPFELEG